MRSSVPSRRGGYYSNLFPIRGARRRIAVAAAATIVSTGAGMARAAEISLNYEAYDDTTYGSPLTSSVYTAGAPGAAALGDTWNNLSAHAGGAMANFWGDNATPPSGYNTGYINYGVSSSNASSTSAYINDDAAAMTSLTTTLTSNFSYRGNSYAGGSIPTGSGSQDTLLFHDGFASDSADTNANVTDVLSNIPYSSYTVYVYFGCNQVGDTGSVSDGTTTFYVKTDSSSLGTFPGYVEASPSGTALSPTSSDYAVFTGEMASTLTITTNSTTTSGLGISGIQIVAVPEPASVVLLSMAAGGLLMRHRRAMN